MRFIFFVEAIENRVEQEDPNTLPVAEFIFINYVTIQQSYLEVVKSVIFGVEVLRN